jgi:predicted GH43/DUF377 family glycosyl hydrolase
MKKLYAIYGNKDGSQIVLEVQGDKVVSEHKSPAPKWSNGEIRGGAIIDYGEGKFLRFFHSRTDYPDKTFRYFIGASLIENKPPFATVKVGRSSIMSGNEIYTPNCKHWKGNVYYPLGVVKDGDKFILSIGVNDSRIALVELTEGQLGL